VRRRPAPAGETDQLDGRQAAISTLGERARLASALYDRLRNQDRFRVPGAIRADDGALVVDAWYPTTFSQGVTFTVDGSTS
jgi:hypothetical protein